MKETKSTEREAAWSLIIVAMAAGVVYQIGLVGISISLILIFVACLGEYLQVHANEKYVFKKQ